MSEIRFWRSVSEAASREAMASPLPGYNDGPADAYRHIVGTAELRRRFGFGTAYAIATGNEVLGTHTAAIHLCLARWTTTTTPSASRSAPMQKAMMTWCGAPVWP